MIINIEANSGFCFGVDKAIKMAEEALRSGEKVYCLGQIVHNEVEVERLEKLGLLTISYDKFNKLKNSKVLIRAHGEPPETYETARVNNIELIEATCPIVKKLQTKIKKNYYANASSVQSIIFGKKDHAEVKGLLGQTGGKSILISNDEDLHKIDYNKASEIFSQTTRSKTKYADIILKIRETYSMKGHKPDKMLKVFNSICGQVSNREPALKEFSKKHDIIVFVSGKKSSNGKMLFKVCMSNNPRSYFVTKKEDINKSWLKGINTIGVCGATSTPKWLISDIAKEINYILTKKT